MNDTTNEQLRKHRAKGFGLEIKKSDSKVYPDDVCISTTHNGTSWVTLAFSREECKKIIRELQAYLDA